MVTCVCMCMCVYVCDVCVVMRTSSCGCKHWTNHLRRPLPSFPSFHRYRAPECLLTDGYYGYKMDLWGVGCVMFEVIALFPLFPGTNELDQIEKIHNVLGTPKEAILSKFKRYSSHIDFNFPPKDGTGIAKMIPSVFSKDCTDIVCKLLAYDPEERLSARQALRHPYFKELRDKDKQQQAAQAAAGGGGSRRRSTRRRCGRI